MFQSFFNWHSPTFLSKRFTCEFEVNFRTGPDLSSDQWSRLGVPEQGTYFVITSSTRGHTCDEKINKLCKRNDGISQKTLNASGQLKNVILDLKHGSVTKTIIDLTCERLEAHVSTMVAHRAAKAETVDITGTDGAYK